MVLLDSLLYGINSNNWYDNGEGAIESISQIILGFSFIPFMYLLLLSSISVLRNSKYSFNHILRDFRFIIKKSHLLINDDDNNEEGNVCIADDCYILNRSDRDKNSYRGRNGDLARLFFVIFNGDDDQEVFKSICCQEIMDTIHCFIYHTIRINPNEISDKERK